MSIDCLFDNYLFSYSATDTRKGLLIDLRTGPTFVLHREMIFGNIFTVAFENNSQMSCIEMQARCQGAVPCGWPSTLLRGCHLRFVGKQIQQTQITIETRQMFKYSALASLFAPSNMAP